MGSDPFHFYLPREVISLRKINLLKPEKCHTLTLLHAKILDDLKVSQYTNICISKGNDTAHFCFDYFWWKKCVETHLIFIFHKCHHFNTFTIIVGTNKWFEIAYILIKIQKQNEPLLFVKETFFSFMTL